ncbi:hypothetical protein FNF27_02391 [Cafeteria roenbergensis]|uniref:Peptidase S49 domain-containing protein n=2 Tax=Cafeteria roenbergensis TaxID=33653 RepID=A0A5A8EEK3_CAFRO|nr:hypothetical protein FNF27_02391 [Cafeteria roenbergensis]
MLRGAKNVCHKVVAFTRQGLHQVENALRREAPKKRALVRVVRLEGTVMSGQGGRNISYERVLPMITAAFDVGPRGVVGDGKTRKIGPKGLPYRPDAVALVINSPGGSPTQASMLFDAIVEARERTGIPVVAFTEDMAASAGYYLACAADEILVDKNSLVGSIGVIHSNFGLTGLIERMGVERRMMTSGARKGNMDPFSEQTEEGKAVMRGLLDSLYENFGDVVRSARGARLGAVFAVAEEAIAALRRPDVARGLHEVAGPDGTPMRLLPLGKTGRMPASSAPKAPEYAKVQDLMQGDVFTGETAVHYGLADGLGRLESTMGKRMVDAGLVDRAEDVAFVKMRRHRNFASFFQDMRSEASAEGLGADFATGCLKALERVSADASSRGGSFRA